MLPQYTNDKDKQPGMLNLLSRSSILSTVKNFIRTIVSNRATRNVFFFLLLNLTFTGVEITYGIWTNSLGLIGDGIHMLFDSSALIGSLIASVIATWPQNDRFTYGLVKPFLKNHTPKKSVTSFLLFFFSFSFPFLLLFLSFFFSLPSSGTEGWRP